MNWRFRRERRTILPFRHIYRRSSYKSRALVPPGNLGGHAGAAQLQSAKAPAMNWSNEVTSADGGWRVQLPFVAQWPAAAEFLR